MLKEREINKILSISFPYTNTYIKINKSYKKDFFILTFNN